MERVNCVTVNELNSDILNNLYRIPNDVDIVVGIPRSGMLVGSLIALYLNIPLTDLDSYLDNRIYSCGRTKRTCKTDIEKKTIDKILVVEDSSNGGNSILSAKKKIAESKTINDDVNIIYLAAYVTDVSKSLVDIYFRIINTPRIFEWNFLHHKEMLSRSCLDLDGVLCVDPLAEENDDGEKYLEFIRNASVRYKPSVKIGWIVTSRLEKYREDTEKWLNNNNIEFEELIMLDCDSASERRKLGMHGSYKGNIYKSLKDAMLFIESEKKQAEEIANISGKSVYCVDASYFYTISDDMYFRILCKRKMKQTIKMLLNLFISDRVISHIKNLTINKEK